MEILLYEQDIKQIVQKHLEEQGNKIVSMTVGINQNSGFAPNPIPNNDTRNFQSLRSFAGAGMINNPGKPAQIAVLVSIE